MADNSLVTAAQAINRGPDNLDHAANCSSCGSSMGPLTQCTKGTIITNFARHFQKCSGCDSLLWRNAPTPLEVIPFEVQTRHALVASSKETGTGLVCQEQECTTASSNKDKMAAALHIGLAPGIYLLPHPHRACPQTASSVSGPVQPPSSQSGPVSYARPLNEAYAQGFVPRNHHLALANSQLEAKGRLNDVRQSSVYVVVWQLENQPATFYTLLNKVAGEFVVADHPILASATVDGFISYLEAPETKTWAVRDARCLGLNDEISRVLIERSDESALTKTRALLALSGSGTEQSKDLASERASSRSITPIERPIAPLRFPLTWAGDMVRCLSALRAARKDTSASALEAAFQQAFPECAFTSGTVYKHLKIFDDAVKFNLVELFSSRGQNPGGKWSDLAKAVEEHRKSVRHIPAPPPPNTPFSDDDLDLGFNVMLAKKEVFRYESGHMLSGTAARDVPYEEMDVLVCDDFSLGHKMKFQQGTYSLSGVPVPVALKRLRIPDFARWGGDREMATWSVGARLADSEVQWLSFANRAAFADVGLADVGILPTFLFSSRDVTETTTNTNTFVAQPWECGVKFSVHTLDRQGPQGDVHAVLSAFSHFTYESSNHRSVCTDFQGLRTLGGWKVFDSSTHMIDELESPSGYPILDSQGQQGIDQFTQNHICGSICRDLQLNAIPLEFPAA
ncbi:hypothetical protein C8R46DRAFT_1287860 [Mycena filopes]|nr:hypothetical protein C8R46DRAFT_1287860 [Mycena filopes]